MLTRDSRISFCSIPNFAERHPTDASNAKCEQLFINLRIAFLHMKKYNLYLILPPIFFNKNIKGTVMQTEKALKNDLLRIEKVS